MVSPGGRYDEIRGEIHEAGLAGKVRLLQDLLFEIDQVIPDTGGHEETACWLLLKGTVLVELGREDDARALFAFLADACPIWEALNNLGVLEAADGDFALAREHLEQALEIAKASGEVDEAKVARGNLRSLTSRVEEPFMNLAGYALECVRVDPPEADCRPRKPVVPDQPVSGSALPEQEPTATGPESETIGSEQLEEVTPEVPPPPPEVGEVQAAVEDWRQSWELRRPDDFFSFYAPDCTHDGGVSHAQWRKRKRANIDNKTRIAVETRGLDVVPGTRRGEWIAVFFQTYRSTLENGTSYCGQGPKTLTFRRFAGGWRIVKETVKWEKIPCP